MSESGTGVMKTAMSVLLVIYKQKNEALISISFFTVELELKIIILN